MIKCSRCNKPLVLKNEETMTIETILPDGPTIFHCPNCRRSKEGMIIPLLGLIAAVIIILIFTLGPAFSSPQQFLEHPRGCPKRAFCGCGAAVHLFGSPIKSLWSSVAWFKFPRSMPAHNTVAVRRGHVFVLKQHIEGKVWLVVDYNSGGRKSRLHHRSIAGHTIVRPQ